MPPTGIVFTEPSSVLRPRFRPGKMRERARGTPMQAAFYSANMRAVNPALTQVSTRRAKPFASATRLRSSFDIEPSFEMLRLSLATALAERRDHNIASLRLAAPSDGFVSSPDPKARRLRRNPKGT
jgi:hypothetical protein